MRNKSNDEIFLNIIKIIGSNIIYLLLISFIVALTVFSLFRYFNNSDFYKIEISFNVNEESIHILDWMEDDELILSNFVDYEITDFICRKLSPGINTSLFFEDDKNRIFLKDLNSLDQNCVLNFVKGFVPSLKISQNIKLFDSRKKLLDQIERYFIIQDIIKSDIFNEKIINKLDIENIISSTTDVDTERALALPGIEKQFSYQLTNTIEVNSIYNLDPDTISEVFNEIINDYFIIYLTNKLNNQISSLDAITDLSKIKIIQSMNSLKENHDSKLEYLNRHLENANQKKIFKNQISFDSFMHYTDYNFQFYGSEYIKELIEYTISEKNKIEQFYKLNFLNGFLNKENFELWLYDNYYVNINKIKNQSYFNVNASKINISTNENLYSLVSFIISFFLLLIFLIYRKLINV